MNEHPAHLLPLGIFTAAQIGALGCTLGATWALLEPGGEAPAPALVPTAAALAIVGLAAAFAHLAHPLRAWRAAAGLAHSQLSREALVASLFALALVAAALGLPARWSLPPAALIGVALALSMGLVYRLPAQICWRSSAAVFAPLLQALVLGAVLASRNPIALALLALDLLAALARLVSHLSARRLAGARLYPRLAPALHLASLARLLTSLAAGAALLAAIPAAATAALALGIVLERFTFYAGAARLTPRVALAELRATRLARARGPGASAAQR